MTDTYDIGMNQTEPAYFYDELAKKTKSENLEIAQIHKLQAELNIVLTKFSKVKAKAALEKIGEWEDERTEAEETVWQDARAVSAAAIEAAAKAKEDYENISWACRQLGEGGQ